MFLMMGKVICGVELITHQVNLQILHCACLVGIHFYLEYCSVLPKAEAQLSPRAISIDPCPSDFIYLGTICISDWSSFPIRMKPVRPFPSVRSLTVKGFVGCRMFVTPTH
jgi:hypothetical protein